MADPAALLWAVREDDVATIRALLMARAEVSTEDSCGNSALAVAVQHGHFYSTLLLLHRGGSPQAGNPRTGVRPIHWAASRGDALLTKLLVKFQANDLANFLSGTAQNPESECPKGHPVEWMQFLVHKVMYPDYVTRKAIPVFVHMATAVAVAEHWLCSRDERRIAVPMANLGFDFLVPSALGFAQILLRMDPGTVANGDGITELVRLIEEGATVASLPKPRQLCSSTWVLKGLRTKYCTVTGTCIEEFDHYCILLDVPIGKGNHRPFLCLMAMDVLAQLCHLFLCLCTLFSNQEHLLRAGPSGAMTMLACHPLLVCFLLLHCATIPGICFLILVQIFLISRNLTMNEMIHQRRYDHFWTHHRVFRNPFCKGSAARNCWDFWWWRTRAKEETLKP
ncbi:unnamed protein product [Effrenium voratum]|nr:unnamed protein product [Effrenium voratum]